MVQDKGTQIYSTCFSCERSKPLCKSEAAYCEHKCNVTQRCKVSTDLCLATMPDSRKWVFTECFPLPAFEGRQDYPHGHCSMKLMAGKYTCLCRGKNCNGNSTFPMANNESTNVLSAKVNQGVQPQAKSTDEPPRDEVKRIVLPAIFVLIVCGVIVGVQVFRRKKPKRSSSHSRIPAEELVPSKDPIDLDLKEVIGRGSFGTVWLAQCYSRQVAVKICKPERVTRWYSEKEIFALDLYHPNVVTFLASEVRLISGQMRFLIVLEYIEGGDLRSFLKSNILTLFGVVKIVASLARGLAYLHSSLQLDGSYKTPVAHRDIKSSNVLLRHGTDCVITDFGLAIATPPTLDVKRVREKMQVGTPRYMSPEKLCSRLNLIEVTTALQQVDVYAFALTVYEIISRCSFQLRNGEIYYPCPYQLPFQSKVGLNPSTVMMKRVVVDNRERPFLSPEWNESSILEVLAWTTRECWDSDPDCRLSSSFIELRMDDLERQCFDLGVNEDLEWCISNPFGKTARYQVRESMTSHSGTTYKTVAIDKILPLQDIELV